MLEFSHCPLCGGFDSLPFHTDRRRVFERCQTCLLVHVTPEYYLVLDEAAFAHWHYKNDPTQACFFSRETFQWWADINGANIEFIGADVIILNKLSPLFG